MKVYSIRERPEYIPALLDSLSTHWTVYMPMLKLQLERVLASPGPLPDAFVAVEGNQAAGAYLLTIRDIPGSDQPGLWVTTPYLDPDFRGQGRIAILLDHARRWGGTLGFKKIYLASERTDYCQKNGFRVVGPGTCVWGDPTQIFESETLPPTSMGQTA
jgi:GNAT superfamily N-acetyltransferase